MNCALVDSAPENTTRMRHQWHCTGDICGSYTVRVIIIFRFSAIFVYTNEQQRKKLYTVGAICELEFDVLMSLAFVRLRSERAFHVF